MWSYEICRPLTAERMHRAVQDVAQQDLVRPMEAAQRESRTHPRHSDANRRCDVRPGGSSYERFADGRRQSLCERTSRDRGGSFSRRRGCGVTIRPWKSGVREMRRTARSIWYVSLTRRAPQWGDHDGWGPMRTLVRLKQRKLINGNIRLGGTPRGRF